MLDWGKFVGVTFSRIPLPRELMECAEVTYPGSHAGRPATARRLEVASVGVAFRRRPQALHVGARVLEILSRVSPG